MNRRNSKMRIIPLVLIHLILTVLTSGLWLIVLLIWFIVKSTR